MARQEGGRQGRQGAPGQCIEQLVIEANEKAKKRKRVEEERSAKNKSERKKPEQKTFHTLHDELQHRRQRRNEMNGADYVCGQDSDGDDDNTFTAT